MARPFVDCPSEYRLAPVEANTDRSNNRMRIALVGKNSFIATSVASEARRRGFMVEALSHNAWQDMRDVDIVINFSLHPNYRVGPYNAVGDQDVLVAQRANEVGALFVMLSTRRVYGADARWNASEDMAADGDESAYGRNKAISEKAVWRITGGKAAIYRLSNVFGFELGRRSFLGQMLTRLREKNEISFDMHPDTRRDFLPVETVSRALLDRAQERTLGVFNLGSGYGTPCGAVAQWVMNGYGSGHLVHGEALLHDEFFLNMDKWRTAFGPLKQETSLEDYCTQLGRRLKCEKY